jgi:deoxycytidine triphosphate deaminase
VVSSPRAPSGTREKSRGAGHPPGFNGQITLEIVNQGRFYVKFVPNPTMICQFIIEKLDTPATGTSSASFQGQTTPIGGGTKTR